MDQSYFAMLGLTEEEADSNRIETAYKQSKRLWDQRRHNPAYQHQWALRQEELARAFETLRRPSKREVYLRQLRSARRSRPSEELEREFKEICDLAMGAGYLPAILHKRLLAKARRMGIPSHFATDWIKQVRLESGTRRGNPAGIHNRSIKQQTFRYFVRAALQDGVLTDQSCAMLKNLSREFGFTHNKLQRNIDELLLEQETDREEESIWLRAARVIGLLVRADQQSQEMVWLLGQRRSEAS